MDHATWIALPCARCGRYERGCADCFLCTSCHVARAEGAVEYDSWTPTSAPPSAAGGMGALR